MSSELWVSYLMYYWLVLKEPTSASWRPTKYAGSEGLLRTYHHLPIPFNTKESASCRSWDCTKTGTRMGFDKKYGAKYAHVNEEARADRSTMDGLKASLSFSTRDRTCWRYGKCLLKAPVRFRTLESHLFLASGTTSSCLSNVGRPVSAVSYVLAPFFNFTEERLKRYASPCSDTTYAN